MEYRSDSEIHVKIVSFGEKSVSYYEEENVGENSCMQHDK
jgi:hypothetical protein